MRSNFVRAWIRTEGVRSLSVSAGTTVADFAVKSAMLELPGSRLGFE